MVSEGQSEVWSSFTHDPRDGQYASLRASDQDRAVVHQVLADAYADGRLDRAEYDQRSAGVEGVRVLGDVNSLLGDLVAPRPAPRASLARATSTDLQQMADREWQRKRREAAYSFLGAGTLTTAIWFATTFHDGHFDPYFFWPAFVIAFSLLHLVRVSTSRGEIVDQEVRRLEKRRDKEQRRPGWLR